MPPAMAQLKRQDYVAANSVLNFAAGENSKTFQFDH
jgi:hypothetical protein